MAAKQRTPEFYISKFGSEEGMRQYQLCEQRREARQRRVSSGRSKKLGSDLEHELTSGNAVRCMGCGQIVQRLQWTHFRSKCKIASLAEYKRLYPDSPLVAPNLIDKTSVTLENMIAAYGDDEGIRRWNHYREKQAETNTFEYKAKTHGWTKEQFDSYNASRAVTLENLVIRHGEEEGLAIWERYCESQRYTNTLEYFMRREGDWEKGLDSWLQYNHAKGSSSRADDIASRMGITREEACSIISQRMSSVGVFVSETEKAFIDSVEKMTGWMFPYSFRTNQYCIWSSEIGRPFFYDACCPQRKKIIEFHGDYWHANPNKYASNYIVSKRRMSAKDIWTLDQLKGKAAIDRGMSLLVVWESDYLTDKNCVSKVVKWLNS